MHILSSIYNLLYNQFSWAYDYVATAVSFGSWNNWVYSLTPYINGPNILEIGFGPGHLISKINQKENRCFGLDASLNMCRRAFNNASNMKRQLKLCQGIAQNLPFKDSIFDQILITFPGNYIFDWGTVSEINRVLKIEGETYIIPYAWLTGNKWYHRFLKWYYPVPDNIWSFIEEIMLRLKNDSMIWDIFLHVNKCSNVFILHGKKT